MKPAIWMMISILHAWSIVWTYLDAERRGKSGWLWAIMVFLFWPISLATWFTFRPAKKS